MKRLTLFAVLWAAGLGSMHPAAAEEAGRLFSSGVQPTASLVCFAADSASFVEDFAGNEISPQELGSITGKGAGLGAAASREGISAAEIILWDELDGRKRPGVRYTNEGRPAGAGAQFNKVVIGTGN